MMHPDTEVRFVSPEIGLGVFATRRIPKGTIAWILDDLDMRLDEERVRALDPLRQEIVFKYAYVGDGGQYVLCWDHARYMNHSASPNLVPTVYGFELCARDVQPGEEIRCDYAVLYAALDTCAPFACAPEEGPWRPWVTSDDYLDLYTHWDALAREAFACFDEVSQPLAHLIQPALSRKVRAVAAGRAEMDSYITLYQQG